FGVNVAGNRSQAGRRAGRRYAKHVKSQHGKRRHKLPIDNNTRRNYNRHLGRSPLKAIRLKTRDLFRWALFGLVAFTADSNRRYYGMQTTWLPHLLTNTLSLLLPDALRLLFQRKHPRNAVEAIMYRMARDNEDYV